MASDKKETVTQEKIIWSLTNDAEKELEEMMDSLMHKIEMNIAKGKVHCSRSLIVQSE